MRTFLTFGAVILLLSGCGGNSSRDPRMVLAEKCRTEGDFPAAERQIRRYLDSHPDNADAHLRLASLYDESLGDPLGAAYHYREYLRLAPGSGRQEAVRKWQTDAVRRCVPVKEPDANPKELARLRRENEELKRLASELEKKLLVNSAPVPASAAQAPAVSPAPPAPAPAPANEEVIYVVRSGDNLSRIARKFYGSSTAIAPIAEANHLTPKSVLFIGQKLKIPKKSR